MTEQAGFWPDPDRCDQALMRALVRVYAQPEPTTRLTEDELAVLQAFSVGLDTRGVAFVLGVSVATVERRVQDARRALRAKNKPHAVAEALRQGLIR